MDSITFDYKEMRVLSLVLKGETGLADQLVSMLGSQEAADEFERKLNVVWKSTSTSPNSVEKKEG